MQIQGKYRCINCFNELNSENESCSCGYEQTQYKVLPHWLFPGTILDSRYYVGRVIGEGGFGITYVGYDVNLDMKIAIKEFFLSGINSRNATVSNDIETGVEEREKLFKAYRDKFINEARVLAKFNDEDGIVTILNFFKSNNTAYIIMEFLDGENLKEYLKRKTKLSVDETLEVFLPIMKTLDDVHSVKLIHRDISPDNIIFTKKGKVKLLDFGAAREVADGNKSLSVVLKHGYAPPEQYKTHGNQGPWTDVYALSATIYKCLTGKTPIEAIERLTGEVLEPVCVITSDCSQKISDVIMKGLEIKIEDRYQSMGEMADELKKAYKSDGLKSVQADKMPVYEKQTDVTKNDLDATVLVLDDKEADVSDKQVHKLEENKKYNETSDNKNETVQEKSGIAQAKKNDATRDKKNDKNVTDIKEPSSSHKDKANNRKQFILLLAAIALCVIAAVGAMLYARSGNKQVENDNPVVAEETSEEVPQGLIDATENSDEESPYVYLKSANVGDIVEFGNYNGFTTWRVLAKNDTELMLITKNVVDRQPFNEENVKCDWSSCTLRTWLNDDYYNKAFTDAEKSLIKESDIDGGKDKVFLLSSDEAKKLFKADIDRKANSSWCLRSPVVDVNCFYYGSLVNGGGYIHDGFHYVNYDIGVRPALNIDLSKITSTQTEIEGQDIQEAKEVAENSDEESPYAYLKSANVGDIVEFGNYNGFTTWRVLVKDNTNLMLITENVVDRQPFNTENVWCDWSSCTLRTWLNEDYYNSAFTDGEKSLIKESDIDGGKDKIFLLSSVEAKTYFKSNDDRIAHNTEYEKELGIEEPYGYVWWLRSPVRHVGNYYNGSRVYNGGFIYKAHNYVNGINGGVRPALNIDLSNL